MKRLAPFNLPGKAGGNITSTPSRRSIHLLSPAEGTLRESADGTQLEYHFTHQGIDHQWRTCGWLAPLLPPAFVDWLPPGWSVWSRVPLDVTLEHAWHWTLWAAEHVSKAIKWENEDHMYRNPTERWENPRELVACAWLLLRELDLPYPEKEPRASIDDAGCRAVLREVENWLAEQAVLRATRWLDVESDKPVPEDEDGPIEPHLFCWKGKSSEKLSIRQLQLLKSLYGDGNLSPQPELPLAKLLCKSTNDPGYLEALRQLCARTQEKLDAGFLKLQIQNSNKHWHLVPMPD